ncbi:hypothetical protein [Methylobacterium oryzihabitans]|uniref:Anti-sigma factor NepR domain-containing protein n=1 Tax=Methylobacterium oryzihabitans TaxID=2499852 RepID=A0A437PGV9_9HYPH|nr:hypothetical protein [Methylobacterium oryzihabitans]RVU21502.1 hypothetical protein EOE48_00115 [Methylobacterium oryzihabitans]
MKVIPSNLAASYGQTQSTASSLSDALLLPMLGHDLRALYGDAGASPVPEELARLIERLRPAAEERSDGV